MCKILVISPYIGLKDLILEVNKDIKKDIDVYVGDLYDGLAIAKSLEHRDYDVIISRGATAKLLKKHFTIPVIEILMTGYDILRTLTLLNGFSGKIGMMSYMNNIPGAHTIGSLLNMDITFYPINEEKEIEGEIERASNDGVQIIIGDVITTTTAAKFGIQAILITSGKEAILETLANVEQIVYYVEKEKNNVRSILQAFELIEDGFLVFDERQSCRFMNSHAKSYLRFIDEIERLTLGKLLDIVPQLKERFSEGNTQLTEEININLNGKTYSWFVIPLAKEGIKGGFALLMKKQEARKYEKTQDKLAYFHFSSLVARSEKMQELISISKKVSKSNLPVIIYGEPGVGKDSLAQAIHNNSERQGRPYVFINCEAYSEPQLERQLFGDVSEMSQEGALEMANEGTLFIDAIGAMPFSIQGKLLQVVTSKQFSRINGTEKYPLDIRFIVAYKEPLEPFVQSDQFREDLYYALNGFTLKVPPLRERTSDLDDLIRISIASSNATTGKQISGFRQSLLDELKELKWPGNIQQLKRAIEQMCLMSDGPFVEHKDVQSLILKLKEKELESDSELNVLQINDKTLQEIEGEVISAVLKLEDFNQSKAAKRLGINRSTLWRKVKQLT